MKEKESKPRTYLSDIDSMLDNYDLSEQKSSYEYKKFISIYDLIENSDPKVKCNFDQYDDVFKSIMLIKTLIDFTDITDPKFISENSKYFSMISEYGYPLDQKK
ncbi:MAG: hypothetical protein NTY74_15090 [Ignavibacteriae bacterium]|nr:hypothetical protein [Ignavibacteriota bacterium]